MRKLILILFLVFCLLSSSFAAPCYGTRMPKRKQFFSGAQTYSIFKRYLEHNFGKLRSTQNFFLLSYGLYDWLALDLKGGAGNIKQHPNGSDEMDYPSFVGGGYGLRMKLYDKKNTRLVFGFQHISIHPRTINIGSVKNKAVLDDWQFSALISYDFKKLTPYIGTRWSRLDYIHWTDGNRNRIKSAAGKSAGLIAGLDIPITQRLWLNLEGQAFDSEAASLSINYGF